MYNAYVTALVFVTVFTLLSLLFNMYRSGDERDNNSNASRWVTGATIAVNILAMVVLIGILVDLARVGTLGR